MIGLLMSVNGLLIIAVEMVLIHKLEGRRHPLIYVGWGILLMGIGFALTNLLPISVWAALLIILFITLGEIFSIPFMNTFWIARTNQNNTGSYAALYSMAWSVAQIIAPVLGGEAIARSGYVLLWWLLGGLTLLSAAGFTAIYLYWFVNGKSTLQIS
jgi:predicted MFS family arabinose efflux permease